MTCRMCGMDRDDNQFCRGFTNARGEWVSSMCRMCLEGTEEAKRCRRCGEMFYLAEYRWVPSRRSHVARCRVCEREARSNYVRAGEPRERAFGVEIELIEPDSLAIERALTNIGVPLRHRDYQSTVGQGRSWELKPDGSVDGEGLELVSPKLYGAAGLETLEKVLAAINSAGARVDRSCGVHIHIDFRSKTFTQVKNAVLPIIRAQQAFFAMCAPSRRSNSYCDEWDRNSIRALERVAALGQLSFLGPRGIVNVMSYPRHGSIEFRSHGGSTNYKKIATWIRLLQKACDAGENDENYSLPERDPRQVCEALGMSPEETEILCRFQVERPNRVLEDEEYAPIVLEDEQSTDDEYVEIDLENTPENEPFAPLVGCDCDTCRTARRLRERAHLEREDRIVARVGAPQSSLADLVANVRAMSSQPSVAPLAEWEQQLLDASPTNNGGIA